MVLETLEVAEVRQRTDDDLDHELDRDLDNRS